MSRISRTVIMERRGRSTIGFRQYLLPKDTSDQKKNWMSNIQISPSVLAAIADQSSIQPPLTFNQKVIKMYKTIGTSVRPQNPFIVFWKVLLALIDIYFIVQIGLLFGFGQAFWQDQLAYVSGMQVAFILILVVDILISPFKSYYDQGLLIRDVSLIYKKFVRLDLWLNLITLVSIIVPLASRNLNSNWIKLLWFLKLYQMSNIFSDLDRLTQIYIFRNAVFIITKLVFFGFFCSHFMAIFFYRVSLYVYESNYYGPNTPNIVWIYNSWAFYQMAFLPWYQMYSYAMYYSIGLVTTIAYGDITPKNPIQCVYTIWTLVLQAIIWGYLISEVIRLLLNIYAYSFSRRYNHYSLNSKLKANLVPDSIFKKVQQHTQQIDRDQQYRNREIQQEILAFLPPDPLYGMLLVLYKQYLYKIGFQFVTHLSHRSLGQTDQKSIFLQSFMKSIREIRHFAGDVLYFQGQIQDFRPQNHCAYCYTNFSYSQSVVLGVGQHLQIKDYVQSLTKAKRTLNVRSFHLKKPKMAFGQIQFLNGEQRSHWAICVKNCLLFFVPRKALLQNYHLLTLQQKQAVVLNAEKAKQRSCFICRNKHEFIDCPYVFVSLKDKVDVSVSRKGVRHLIQRTEYRTRLKTMSPWRLFAKIKNTKVNITKAYKDKLFYDKSAHELFVSLELQQGMEKQNEEFDLHQEMFETQVIIDSIYRKQLEDLGLNEQQWSCETVYSFKHYKHKSNVQQVSVKMAQIRNARKQRRHINSLK